MKQQNSLARTPEYREGKHKLKSIRWMLFFVVAVQTLVTVVANIISSFFEEPLPVYLQILVIELLAYLLPLSLYARENRLLTAREAREDFGLKPCKKTLWPWVLLAGVGGQFMMCILNLPINLLLVQSDGYVAGSVAELIAAMVVIGIVPAVFEEFLLRGIVYGVMARYNTKAAMIFVTVMFALMHASLAGFVGYLFLGLTLVVLLQRTGSLYACIGFHLVNNVTAILLSYFSGQMAEDPFLTLWVFALGLIAAVIGWVGLMTWTRRTISKRELDTKVFLGQSFVNLPILLCICCIIGLFFL